MNNAFLLRRINCTSASKEDGSDRSEKSLICNFTNEKRRPYLKTVVRDGDCQKKLTNSNDFFPTKTICRCAKRVKKSLLFVKSARNSINNWAYKRTIHGSMDNFLQCRKFGKNNYDKSLTWSRREFPESKRFNSHKYALPAKNKYAGPIFNLIFFFSPENNIMFHYKINYTPVKDTTSLWVCGNSILSTFTIIQYDKIAIEISRNIISW